ncbi:HGGxSTG domain-containing protein [Bacillus sp. FJAT-45037]|uniref:HGGxSTG domain-containing protein n=1 Tax=Bacillus sp. FJAT-45037 TaxID=2011007 RepID=UPI000C2496D1|nr:HGGxSTG domain-containing protein [Bacillus sp. FJAT-45037]
MPSFKDLDTRLQAKVKTVQSVAIEEDKDIAKTTSAYKELKKSHTVCGALQGLGERVAVCTRAPHFKEDESTNGRCAIHGGKSTGATSEEGKRKSISKLRGRSKVHGLYSPDFLQTLSQEELDFIDWCEEGAKQSYIIETVFEEYALQAITMEALRHMRMVNTRFDTETKNASEHLTKFIRLIESQGWRRREMNEEKKQGLSVRQMVSLLNAVEDDEEEEYSSPAH